MPDKFQILLVFMEIPDSSLQGKYFEYFAGVLAPRQIFKKYSPRRLLPDIPIKHSQYLVDYFSGNIQT